MSLTRAARLESEITLVSLWPRISAISAKNKSKDLMKGSRKCHNQMKMPT